MISAADQRRLKEEHFCEIPEGKAREFAVEKLIGAETVLDVIEIAVQGKCTICDGL